MFYFVYQTVSIVYIIVRSSSSLTTLFTALSPLRNTINRITVDRALKSSYTQAQQVYCYSAYYSIQHLGRISIRKRTVTVCLQFAVDHTFLRSWWKKIKDNITYIFHVLYTIADSLQRLLACLALRAICYRLTKYRTMPGAASAPIWNNIPSEARWWLGMHYLFVRGLELTMTYRPTDCLKQKMKNLLFNLPDTTDTSTGKQIKLKNAYDAQRESANNYWLLMFWEIFKNRNSDEVKQQLNGDGNGDHLLTVNNVNVWRQIWVASGLS